ncbi:MAG: SDR family oxidoreductase [Ignavibacteriae bacterium]|nr:SDR family oxidoreductase [Ignavibacteriota bacterium]NOG99851.1 SDR family oxidoreductase [Ignavibacteriota bacterium]
MELQDKIVLVTGGGSGIGLAIAVKAKSKGAKVIICGRNEDKLKTSGEKFDLTYYRCDVSKESDVLSLFDKLKSEFGDLDVLINNAGFGYFSMMDEFDAEKFLAVYETNVLGAALMAREAAKIFKEKNNGTIINVGSTAALKGFVGGSAYSATKFALRGLSECWRAELRKFNVRVMQVNPSEVQTQFFETAASDSRDFNPTKLIAEDIAHAVISAIEMNDRGFTTEFTVFATNPQ